MGCDAYTDEDGEFELEVRCYKTGKILGNVALLFLDPNKPLQIEIMKGEER